MNLYQRKSVVDLKSHVFCGDIIPSFIRSFMPDEYRSHHLCTSTRLSSKTSISALRQTLSWQLSNQVFLMLRPVLIHGICAIKLQRKPQRYRNMLKGIKQQIISLRLSRENVSKQSGKCQREKKLENLRRLRTGAYQKSKATLSRRRFWSNVEKHRICFGFDHYRSLPHSVPVGTVSQTQKCCKNTYTYGPERLDSVLYTHHSRGYARYKSYASNHSGAGRFLCNGQSLHRFCNAIQFYKEQFILCYTSKKEPVLHPPELSFSRQRFRFAKRPYYKTGRSEDLDILSRINPADRLSGYRTKQKVRISDKQLRLGCFDNRRTLQMPLADRVVLQMGETTSENQSILRNQHQRRQNPNMGSNQHICACSDNQKGIKDRAFTYRNPANSQHFAFRENLAVSSTYDKLFTKQRAKVL